MICGFYSVLTDGLVFGKFTWEYGSSRMIVRYEESTLTPMIVLTADVAVKVWLGRSTGRYLGI